MNKIEKTALARSRSIDHQIDKDRERRQKQVQLLMSGSGGSGKSTIIKQLRLHYGDGFPEHFRRQQTPYVIYNISCALHVLLDQMDVMGIQYSSCENQKQASEFQRTHPCIPLDTMERRYSEEEEQYSRNNPGSSAASIRQHLSLIHLYVPCLAQVSLLKMLWSDSGVKKSYTSCQTFPRHILSASSQYFLENIERMLKKEYIPTVMDILYTIWPTLGVQEHEFSVDGLQFKVIDVAGQKSLRKKWIHLFQGVTAIIFVVALSGYDETLEEEPATNISEDTVFSCSVLDNCHIIQLASLMANNMMRDSLQAFREVSHNNFLENTQFILFLNKKDIFVEKLKVTCLSSCFPQYEGGQCLEEGIRYIEEQFIDCKPINKQCYTHVTCAIDVSIMKHVLCNVMGKVVNINLKHTNLF